MRRLLTVWIVLMGAVCAVSTPTMADSPRPSVGISTDQNCQEYSGQVIIDGQPRTAYGHACLRPDGSWRILPDVIVPLTPPQSIAGPQCVDRIESCDRSCDDHGILGARHTHADCSRTCDLICGMREGYAAW